jgi:peptide/nickel transport system permease protein
MLMRYAAMRLVQLIPMVLVVTMVVFFVMMIVPGDPVMVMLGAVDGAQVPQQVYDAMRVRLGLDQPLIVQYLNWLSNLLQGDLGTSITYRTSALEVILQRLVPTIYLMVGGLVIAVIIAVPAGVLAAIHNSTKWDHLATGFVVVGISVPTFWLALVAILIFAVYLGWLPSIG